jgi:hypothetical protein
VVGQPAPGLVDLPVVGGAMVGQLLVQLDAARLAATVGLLPDALDLALLPVAHRGHVEVRTATQVVGSLGGAVLQLLDACLDGDLELRHAGLA